MDRQAVLRRACRILLGVNAIIWLAFGAVVALGAHPALPEGELVRWLLAGGALVGALVLGTLILFLERNPLAFYLILGMLVLVAVMTVFDQFGYVDLAFLILTVLPITLLLWNRRSYLGEGQATGIPSRS